MSYTCVCEFDGNGCKHICLSHLRWLQIIDAARPIMEQIAECDPAVRQWLRDVAEVPKASEFPLIESRPKRASRKATAVNSDT